MWCGVLEFCVLVIVVKKEVYFFDIIVEFKVLEFIVVEGIFYLLFSCLKDQGLLEYNWQEFNMGLFCKYYFIIEIGCIFFIELLQIWGFLVQVVDYFM